MNLPIEKNINDISVSNIVKTVTNYFNRIFSTNVTPEFLKQKRSKHIFKM